MTYLQLINGVLRRMRESEVSTIGADDYVNLVGDFVNDAKRTVEDSWNWNALRTAFTINAVSGTAVYALTGAESRAVIDNVTNDTQKTFLMHRSPNWLQRENLSPAGNAAPSYFIVTGTDSSGDTEVTLYPTPDASYTVTANTWLKQADLTTITDVIQVPHAPVLQLALALAARERGEVGGQTALELFANATRTLSDAISLDAALNPSGLVFYTV
jgi:hypothetical protein